MVLIDCCSYAIAYPEATRNEFNFAIVSLRVFVQKHVSVLRGTCYSLKKKAHTRVCSLRHLTAQRWALIRAAVLRDTLLLIEQLRS